MYQRILLTLASGAAILGTWGVLIPSAGGVENTLKTLPGVVLFDMAIPNRLPDAVAAAQVASRPTKPDELRTDSQVADRQGIGEIDRRPAGWVSGTAGF